jgi:hypothetical protein
VRRACFGTDACRVVQCIAALRIFLHSSFPSLSCMTYACIYAQDGKFSSISSHVRPGKTWGDSYIYRSCSVLPFRFQFIIIGYLGRQASTSLNQTGGSTASISLCLFSTCIDITTFYDLVSDSCSPINLSLHIFENVFQHRSAALGFLLVCNGIGLASSKHDSNPEHCTSQWPPSTRCSIPQIHHPRRRNPKLQLQF